MDTTSIVVSLIAGIWWCIVWIGMIDPDQFEEIEGFWSFVFFLPAMVVIGIFGPLFYFATLFRPREKNQFKELQWNYTLNYDQTTRIFSGQVAAAYRISCTVGKVEVLIDNEVGCDIVAGRMLDVAGTTISIRANAVSEKSEFHVYPLPVSLASKPAARLIT